MNERRCWSCKRTLPLDAFPRRPTRPGGHDYQCKECMAERIARRRAEERAVAFAERGGRATRHYGGDA